MGVLFDYFSAPSDAAAGAVVEAGPSREEAGELPAVLDTGIDPVVMVGTLEALLTGRSYEEVTQDARWGKAVVVLDEGERVVVTLTDQLVHALADADDERLTEVAESWAATEEFHGRGEADVLAGTLGDLATLARGARDAGQGVYCWVCV